MKIGTITVMNEEVAVDADTNGSFWLYIEHPPEEEDGPQRTDHLGRGETLEAAKRQARVELGKRRIEVALPFVTRDGRRGIAIKRNLRTRGVIVEIEGERDEIGRGYNRGSTFKEDTPTNVTDRLGELDKNIREMDTERSNLEDKWKMDLASRLDQVVAETAAERESAGVTA